MICGMKSWLLLCLAGALLGSGCTSMRVTTSLKPEADPALKSPAGKFYVAGIKWTDVNQANAKQADIASLLISGSARTTGTDKPQGTQSEIFGQNLLPLLREECVARYPSLFLDDTLNAIPIWVEVRTSTIQHNAKTRLWSLCTVFLAPLIFPLPSEMDCNTDVTVGLWNGSNGMGSGTTRKSYRNGVHMWLSLLTPLGLIPMPGKSDFPKSSFFISPDEATYSKWAAEQLSTAIAKLVTVKNSAFLTTPAQGQGQGVSGVQPSVTPTPKDFAAPF